LPELPLILFPEPVRRQVVFRKRALDWELERLPELALGTAMAAILLSPQAMASALR
jgi:hypothetical protein